MIIWKRETTLFDCTKQNVSYHMGKIFASGELDRSTVVKEILTTAQSGARGLSEDKVLYYSIATNGTHTYSFKTPSSPRCKLLYATASPSAN